MPGHWLISRVLSRSFSWTHRTLWGPLPTVTVLKKGSSLGRAETDLWPTFHDSSLFRVSKGRPSCAPRQPLQPPVTLQLHLSSVRNRLFLWGAARFTADTKFFFNLHRERKSVRGCWSEAEEFRSEVWFVGEQPIVDHNGQEAELPTSGKSWGCWH